MGLSFHKTESMSLSLHPQKWCYRWVGSESCKETVLESSLFPSGAGLFLKYCSFIDSFTWNLFARRTKVTCHAERDAVSHESPEEATKLYSNNAFTFFRTLYEIDRSPGPILLPNWINTFAWSSNISHMINLSLENEACFLFWEHFAMLTIAWSEQYRLSTFSLH